MVKRLVTLSALIGLLSGCLTLPNNTEDTPRYFIGLASTSISEGDCVAAEKHMTSVLFAENGRAALSNYFVRNEAAKNCFFSLQKDLIKAVDTPYKANRLHNKFRALESVESVSGNYVTELIELLENEVADGNRSDKIQFSFVGSIANFPSLSELDHQKILAARTLKLMSDNQTSSRPIRRLVGFINTVGASSPEGKQVLSVLESLNLTINEMAVLNEIYPELYSNSVEDLIWPDAFSRRSYQLGITLSQFRQIKHPDHSSWPNAIPVCSHESRAKQSDFRDGLTISEGLSKAGVIKCRHFYRATSTSRIFPAGLLLGDLPAITEFYFIKANDSDPYRLFYVRSTGPSDSYSGLYLVLDSAFGRPASSQDELLSNAMGAQFVNHKHIWRKPSSRIELNKYSESLRRLEIKFILDPLWDIYMERLEENISEKANRI